MHAAVGKIRRSSASAGDIGPEVAADVQVDADGHVAGSSWAAEWPSGLSRQSWSSPGTGLELASLTRCTLLLQKQKLLKNGWWFSTGI